MILRPFLRRAELAEEDANGSAVGRGCGVPKVGPPVRVLLAECEHIFTRHNIPQGHLTIVFEFLHSFVHLPLVALLILERREFCQFIRRHGASQ
jgi:hypothetical protein